MIFRDVQLVNAGKHTEEKLSQNRYLMAYWDNVEDIFCTLLPKKIDLNGISKVNIYLGQFDGEDYLAPSSNGIATFRRHDFDFESFKLLNERDKNEKSLSYIEDSLLTICDRFNIADSVKTSIKAISQEIREMNFSLKRIHKKTTKWNKSRTLRAITKLSHKVGGIDVEFTLVDKQGVVIDSHLLMRNAIWQTVWFELFKSSWQEERFIIESRVGEPTFTIESSGKLLI